ncbi:MAG TPA: MarR family transcriptional regulator [Candidatus Binatus sp.]|nr:MarR family transcriptional regulator [Candidatus Binatus sp.]
MIPNYLVGTLAEKSFDVKHLDSEFLQIDTHAMKRTADQPDKLDARLTGWKREIPGLDGPTEGIVERIQVLAHYFNRSLEDTLVELGMDRRAYWLIGQLRFVGAPYRQSPGQLADSLHLSSGAMTARLDRLEAAGLIRRLPDPTDRRGSLIEPTEAGHAAWERCTGVQAQREALIAGALSEAEKAQLHGLLRRLMRAFPPSYDHPRKHHSEPED